MELSYSITPRSLNILIKGRMRTIDNTHLNYAKIVEKLKLGPKEWAACYDFGQWLLDHIDIKAFVAKYTEGTIAIGEDDQVYHAGQVIHSYAAKRLIDMMKDGFDLTPLAKFIDRLMTNPEEGVKTDLFRWLESGNMPLTPDGCFLAFKKVNDNYYSYNSGPEEHCNHNIGKRPTMERSAVNNNRHETCSRGLHFCSYEYLSQYHGGSGHVVILKIAPEDVVAIPYDYNDTKGRAWTYEVIDEVPEDEAKQFFPYSVDSRYDAPLHYDALTPEQIGDNIVLDDNFEEISAEESGEAWANVDAEIAAEIAKLEKAQSEVIIEVASSQKKLPTFEHNGTKFTPKKLEKEVDKLGQRGFAAKYNVARSTVQGWLKKLR
jgi:hypothetical protein